MLIDAEQEAATTGLSAEQAEAIAARIADEVI
jgi:hypothetical protein